MRASDTAKAAIMRMARSDLFMMNRRRKSALTLLFCIGCCYHSAWCAGQAGCGRGGGGGGGGGGGVGGSVKNVISCATATTFTTYTELNISIKRIGGGVGVLHHSLKNFLGPWPLHWRGGGAVTQDRRFKTEQRKYSKKNTEKQFGRVNGEVLRTAHCPWKGWDGCKLIISLCRF